jgi:cytochrome P450 family 4
VKATTKKRLSLLDLLLSYHLEDKTMTEEEVQDHLDTFTFAGHDTTALTLTFVLWRIARHQDIQKKLQEEVDGFLNDKEEKYFSADGIKQLPFLEMVLKETQRYYPVAAHVVRRLDEDLFVDGFRIPAGASVCVDISALHRDPEVFEEPLQFRPERFNADSIGSISSFAYTPFSGGPRNCIGFRFALTEMKIMIAHLVRDFSMHLVDEVEEIETSFDVLIHPKDLLRITFNRRD